MLWMIWTQNVALFRFMHVCDQLSPQVSFLFCFLCVFELFFTLRNQTYRVYLTRKKGLGGEIALLEKVEMLYIEYSIEEACFLSYSVIAVSYLVHVSEGSVCLAYDWFSGNNQ